MASIATNDSALGALVEQVRDAIHVGYTLYIQGGGTKTFYGGTHSYDAKATLLDMKPLTGISSYEPTELVVTARAGTSLADLEACLAKRGQCLAFEPPRFADGGTVGGMVAAGLAGPARARSGGVRDYVLGVTLLDGQARVLTFGGQVMKNVAGYDVSRIMAGSLGVLGVILEVSLKVLPLPKATATLVFDMSQAQALDQLARWAARPWPVTASAWHDSRLWLRLSGAQAAVRQAQQDLGGELVDAQQAEVWWRGWRDHLLPGLADPLPAGQSLWRISVPGTAPVLDVPGELVGLEWAGAQRWLRTDTSAAKLRQSLAKVGGHATCFRGQADDGLVFMPPAPAVLQIQQRLKAAFDPAGIFNPGRLYPNF